MTEQRIAVDETVGGLEVVHLFTGLSWGGLLVVSLLGLGWLLVVRRRADREARAVLWRIPVTAGRPPV